MFSTRFAAFYPETPVRAKRLDRSYADFAGPWRGMEREKFMEMANTLLPDAVLVVWKVSTRQETMHEIWDKESAHV